MKRILFIDDSLMENELARRTLSSFYDVVTTNTEDNAIEIFKNDKNFDLIIVDICLQHVNGGFILAKKFREMMKPQNIWIPIVGYSVLEKTPTFLNNAVESGISYFIEKPLDINDVDMVFDNPFYIGRKLLS